MPLLALVIGLLLILSAAAHGQGTADDYQRAARLRQTTQNKVFRSQVRPQWLPGSSRLWYRLEVGPREHQFVLVDAAHGERQPAFDHARLAAALTRSLGRDVSAEDLPIDRLSLDEKGERLEFAAGGKRLSCSLATYELAEDQSGGQAIAERPRWLDRPQPSSRTGAEVTLTFVNSLTEAVELFWSDDAGQRRSYGRIEAGGRHEQHTYEGHVWMLVGAGGALRGILEATADAREVVIDGSQRVRRDSPRFERSRGDRRRPPAQSPDGKSTAFVKENNLWLRPAAGGEEFAISTDGTADDGYSANVYWSPDSRRLVALRTKRIEERKINLIESSPRDQLQPRLITLDYAKPGDPRTVPVPHLFDVESRKEIALSNELFANPYSIEGFRWAADSSRFTFLYNQRGHQVLRLIAVDAADGKVRAILDEQSPTFIDYAHKQFIRQLDTGEILWMSERDGWNHLYLIDGMTGEVKNAITHGPWIVRSVERVDEEQRQLLLRVSGIDPAQDPYYIHYVRVNFDGSGLVRLTEGDGTHRIEFSPDGKYVLDTYSRVDQPPVTELRSAEDGRLLCELERGDCQALLETGWQTPERFAAKGRDGQTDIYGVIWRPTNFDASKKYPVIESIYAGPQGQFVPKEFRSHYRQQELAELGFIVVQIDGMGTNWRSKAFHDVCWRNLADAGFPDRIAWMKSAAEGRPYMDLSRVGVYGGSAGGQNALGAVLHHGEFYKAAAADCGCHDNRMDKMWWNEAWMGYPIGPHYEQNSNVTHAGKLRGKLLLTFGELDRNVDPASTMQVVNALVKAGKDFELLIVPGAGHGVGESPYGARRRADFFVRHLLGALPPNRNQ
ncbi:MAG TPA: DPP IV N-terminal domain-containing protein [Pirellulaceae bacterium]|nr:DPP IV N-terminal domain-containing protein [Pirellulaceae bacterium]